MEHYKTLFPAGAFDYFSPVIRGPRVLGSHMAFWDPRYLAKIGKTPVIQFFVMFPSIREQISESNCSMALRFCVILTKLGMCKLSTTSF